MWGWFNSILIDIIFILPKEFFARSVSWWQIPSIFIYLRKFLFFLYLDNNLAGYRILSCEFFFEHFRSVLLIVWFLRKHSPSGNVPPLSSCSQDFPTVFAFCSLHTLCLSCGAFAVALISLHLSLSLGQSQPSLPQTSLPFLFPSTASCSVPLAYGFYSWPRVFSPVSFISFFNSPHFWHSGLNPGCCTH